jgi:hypothetical protein
LRKVVYRDRAAESCKTTVETVRQTR